MSTNLNNFLDALRENLEWERRERRSQQNRIHARRYGPTPKGKATQRRYWNTDKRRARQRRWYRDVYLPSHREHINARRRRRYAVLKGTT